LPQVISKLNIAQLRKLPAVMELQRLINSSEFQIECAYLDAKSKIRELERSGRLAPNQSRREFAALNARYRRLRFGA
jgi:hypothetical protein